MELSDSKIEKFLIFSQKKASLIILEMEFCTFQPKIENIHTEKVSYLLYSGKIELTNSNIKKFLIFSRKKAFLIFRETKTPKKFLTFPRKDLFIYYRKRKPRKNSLYFRKWKPKKFFIFQEMELSSISGSNFSSSKTQKIPL